MTKPNLPFPYSGQVLELGMIKRHGVAGLMLYVPKRIAERLNLSSNDKSLVLFFDDEVGLICIKDAELARLLSPKILKAREVAKTQKGHEGVRLISFAPNFFSSFKV